MEDHTDHQSNEEVMNEGLYKRDSWHYRLICWNSRKAHHILECNSEVSFCWYSRQLVWAFVGALFVAAMATVGAILVAATVLAAVYGIAQILLFITLPHLGIGMWMVNGEHAAMAFFSFLAMSIIFGIGAVKDGHMKIVPNWMKFSLPKVKVKKNTTPSIVIEYFKAKKQKICPTMRFEDVDKVDNSL